MSLSWGRGLFSVPLSLSLGSAAVLIGFIDTAASAGGTADEPGAGGVSVNDVVLRPAARYVQCSKS